MTAIEEAIELIESFKFETNSDEIVEDLLLGNLSVKFKHHKAKQCALIAVDKMIDMLMTMNKYMVFPQHVKYYQEVRKEIEKL